MHSTPSDVRNEIFMIRDIFKDNRNTIIYLSCILIASLLLRIWGIWNAEHTDEYNEVFEALRVCSGHLNYYRWFKRFFLYILSIEYGCYFCIGWLFHHFASPMDFAAKIVRDMTPLFQIGRITNAIIGTASVYIVYLLGKRIINERAGLFAAFFLGFSMLHIFSSHLVDVDVSMCFLLLLSFLFMIRIWQDKGKIYDYAMASFIMGLAIQAKLPAILLFVPFIIVHVAIWRIDNHEWLKMAINRRVLFAGLFFVAGFILGNPAIVVKPIAFLQSGFGLKTLEKGKNVYDIDINGWIYYIKILLRDIGLTGATLCLCGVVASVIKPKIEHLLVIILATCLYCLFAQESKLVFARYMIPVVAMLSLAAAVGLEAVLAFFKLKTQNIIILMIVSLQLFNVLPNIYKYSVSLYGKNTRYLAKEWIEQNIPAKSKILLQTGRSINSDAPPIHQTRKNIENKVKEIKSYLQHQKGTFDAPGLVDKNAIIYYELLLKTDPKITYNITSTEFYRNIQDYEYYLSNRYEYAIIKSDSQDFYSSDKGMMANPRLYHFYSSLKKKGRLLKEFGPSKYHRGERFRIYAF